MLYYPALIHRSGDGWSLGFPDLPGCVTTGRDMGELLAHAEEALTLHLEGMAADGGPIPEPSEPDAPLPDWLDESDRGVVAMVPVSPLPLRKEVSDKVLTEAMISLATRALDDPPSPVVAEMKRRLAEAAKDRQQG
jgi:predicted RNase H-like HicB family nuclease